MSIELVWKKSDCTVEFLGLTIHAAPMEYPPFTYQAIIEEQDTNLLLSEQKTLIDPGKPAWYFANMLEGEATHPLGTVIIKGKYPNRLLAVVHDIECTPTCEAYSIQQAWKNVMQTIEDNHITALATPLLGSVHGKLSITNSLELMCEGLQQNLPICLEKIWLVLPKDGSCDCLTKLKIYNGI